MAENHVSEKPTQAAGIKAQEDLPPLSAADFRIYNHMADGMDMYHNHFRATWTTLWTACTTNKRPQGMSIRQFIATGLRFTSSLTMHHGIEEQHIFPLLATRMPEFQPGAAAAAAGETSKGGLMVAQHRQIHAGLDGLEAYLRRCEAGEEDLEMRVLRGRMEGWGGVLWEHLDEEVRTLGAANMRRYWSKQEMRQMPM